jgi:hypothetical protein
VYVVSIILKNNKRNFHFSYRSVRTIQIIKDIHQPFWTSLFSIPDQDENTIDKLAENLEKTASIKN